MSDIEANYSIQIALKMILKAHSNVVRFSLNIFYLPVKQTKWIRHKLNKLMKSSPRISLGTDYLTFFWEGYFYPHPAVFFFTYPKICIIIIIIIPTFTEKEILNMNNHYFFFFKFQYNFSLKTEAVRRIRGRITHYVIIIFWGIFLVFFFYKIWWQQIKKNILLSKS